MRYVWNIGVALSQLVNTVLAGEPGETLSERMGRAKRCWLCRWICKALDYIQPGHCSRRRK